MRGGEDLVAAGDLGTELGQSGGHLARTDQTDDDRHWHNFPHHLHISILNQGNLHQCKHKIYQIYIIHISISDLGNLH